MRIAVTYDHGEVFQHFGHCQQFKLYEEDEGEILRSTVVDAGGSGHGALAGFLKSWDVDAVICGGIGPGAQQALHEAGILLYGGVAGSADDAAAALAAGKLRYDPEARCDHHDHEHGEGHSCGDGEEHHCCGGEGHDHGEEHHCCH